MNKNPRHLNNPNFEHINALKSDEVLPTTRSLECSTKDKINKETVTLDIQLTSATDGNNDGNNIDPINEVTGQNIPLNSQNTNNPITEAPTSSTDHAIPASDPLTQMTPEELYVFTTSLPEAGIHMNKVMALFVAMILTSLIVRAPVIGLTHFQMLIIGSLVFAFAWGIIEIYWTLEVLGDIWLESGEFFKALDAGSFIIMIFIMLFRATGLITNSLYAWIPFLMVSMVYFLFAKNTLDKNLPDVLTRFYYCIQVLLFLVKLDDHVDWSWNTIFFLSWVFVAAKICGYIYFIGTLFHKVVTKPYPRTMKILGFIWNVGAKGLFIAPVAAFYGFVQYANDSNGDFEFISKAALVNIGVNAVLLFIALLVREPLMIFIVKMGLFKSFLLEYGREQQGPVEKKEVAFKAEKKEEYFVVLSPTYFLPLKKSFYTRSQEKINKIKEMFGKLRGGNKDKTQTEQKKSRSFAELKDLEGQFVSQQDILSMSFDGAANIKEVQDAPIDHKGEESLCYICYSNPSNVILMNCGHGGICYNCAVPLMKQKNTCMQCRKDVDGIFVIDPHPKLADIVRGVEFQKLVL